MSRSEEWQRQVRQRPNPTPEPQPERRPASTSHSSHIPDSEVEKILTLHMGEAAWRERVERAQRTLGAARPAVAAQSNRPYHDSFVTINHAYLRHERPEVRADLAERVRTAAQRRFGTAIPPGFAQNIQYWHNVLVREW